MKNQTVQVLTPGQMKEIISAVVEGIPADLAFSDAQHWIGKKKKLAVEIRKIFTRSETISELLSDWGEFYRDLGITCDLAGVKIPEDPGGFERVIIMAQGITPQSAYDLCAKNFSCWKWTDQNLSEIVNSERSAKNGAYAIRVRDRVEADEELKNLSANMLKEKNIAGVILEERLAYELKYFKETGGHLDIENWTLCSGSRCRDGYVPSVNWDVGRLYVNWYFPGFAHGYLRSRQAVS